MKIHENYDFSKYTSLKIKVKAKFFVCVKSEKELLEVLENFKDEKVLFIGEASNIFFYTNFDGLVIKNLIQGINISEDSNYYSLQVKSGNNWHQLVEYCLKFNINGFENLALIPGSVGACPIQNIGAYGREVSDFISSVEYIDLKSKIKKTISSNDCKFGYRTSIFKTEFKDFFIIAVNFKIAKNWQAHLTYSPLNFLSKEIKPKGIFAKVCNLRRDKLPDHKKIGNLGSFFVNPIIEIIDFEKLKLNYNDIPHFKMSESLVKIPAAYLIDKLDFKGYKIGGAEVYQKQPLVLVNANNASAKDLVFLAFTIRARVFEVFNILLEHEVNFIGSRALSSLDKAWHLYQGIDYEDKHK